MRTPKNLARSRRSWTAAAAVLVRTAQRAAKDNSEDKKDEAKPDDKSDDPKSEDEVKPPEPASDRLKLVDFPNTKLEAEKGQWVFAPNDSSFAAAHGGKDKHRLGQFSYGIVMLGEIGDVESEIKSGNGYKIPNSYIIPIAKGAEVAAGDIVLTSKYGNSIETAYVMKVGDTIKANFIETMPFGDKSDDLKPDKYFKLTEGMAPGSQVAVRMAGMVSKSKIAGMDVKVTSSDSVELFTVLRVAGDNVLLTGHMGKIAVAPKGAVIPIPLAPDVKKGDKIFAVWDTAHFTDGTLQKIDKKLGHYLVKFGDNKKDARVPFAELLTGSKADYIK